MNIDSILKTAKTHAIAWLPKLGAALAIAIIGWLVAGIAGSVVSKLIKRSTKNDMLSKFIGSIVTNLLRLMVVIAAVGQLGVDTTSFAAVLGAMGLAIGLAFQNSLGNFASGVMLIIFQPFKTGEMVNAGGVEGLVQEVSMFATTLLTLDNKRITVGNQAITKGAITNYSREETRRVDLVFGIGYGDDIDKARDILTKIVSGHKLVLADPAYTIAVHELADSSVNFVVRPWCKTEDYWTVYWDIIESVKKTFDKEGISIPFPQQDVHMHEVKAA